jgi:hypothetical protein
VNVENPRSKERVEIRHNYYFMHGSEVPRVQCKGHVLGKGYFDYGDWYFGW